MLPRILLAGSFLLVAGPVLAQTAPSPNTQTPTGPTQSPPNDITPPNGVARGVVTPTHPVDPGMVTAPPTHGQTSMPVIKPPGTAR